MTKLMIWTSAFALWFALPWQATPAAALVLCAEIDETTSEPRVGSPVKLRPACKTKGDGTPVEVEISATHVDPVDAAKPTGVTSDRWTENGDGSATDALTGLIWELKTDDGTIHDQTATHTWSAGDPFNADGTAYTEFLAALNAEPCFAGHCDWRLPTIEELKTLIDEVCPDNSQDDRCRRPCTTIPDLVEYSENCLYPRPGEQRFYWSSSTYADGSLVAGGVSFPAVSGDVFVAFGTKGSPNFVRAVRDGS